jgi:hypothetical protein
MSPRDVLGAALVCAQPGLLWIEPFTSSDPLWGWGVGIPFALAGGYVAGRKEVLWVPIALSAVAILWLYSLDGDQGILDPFFLAAIYLACALPPAALGIAAARRRRRWRSA